MSDDFSTKRKGPRVIKKHKESEFTDHRSPWYRITVALGILAAAPAYILLNYVNPMFTEYALAAWAISAAIIWYDCCGMDPVKAKKTWTHFWFVVDELLGRHTFNRITTGVSWFERLLGRKLSVVYPVKAIYRDGLTQFDDNQWAYYVILNRKKRKQTDKKLHTMYMEAFINGMFDYQIVKLVTMRKKNPRKQVIDYLMKMLKTVTDRLRAQHLNSLIQASLNKKVQPKVTRHILMIGLGEHVTYEEAVIAKLTKVPGMLKKLERVFKPTPIENSREVEKLLRENMGETAVF